MRIVSWNIRAGGGRRVDAIASQIDRWQPDIVVLQEFRGTPPSSRLSSALREQGLSEQHTTADGARPRVNSLLIASRWPITPLRGPSAPRDPYRWALVGARSSAPFALGALHSPNQVSGRKYPFLDAVLNVAKAWRWGPGLLIGDSNSGRIGLDEEVPVFSDREDGWFRALEQAGWTDAFRRIHGAQAAYTWHSPSGRIGFRLDQGFVNEQLVTRLREARHAWGASAADKRREALSDHAALLLDFG